MCRDNLELQPCHVEDHPTVGDWGEAIFDEAIQPGAKNFDFNMQQYSITPEREEMVDFSLPYYSSAMAILTTNDVMARFIGALLVFTGAHLFAALVHVLRSRPRDIDC